MFLAKSLSYYKREEVQQKLVEHAKDKEVAVQFQHYFGKRPDVLVYENDVMEFAMKKASSFHCSEELWSNPLNISSNMKRKDLDELRIGWDLILDIDCPHFIYSKLAAHLLVKILKDLNIKSITCKFSGNKGFHLAVPFEAFPEQINNIPAKDLFPEAPRKIAYYLKDKLKPLLEKAILKVEKNNINKILERTGLKYEELVFNKKNEFSDNDLTIDSERFLEIDTVLIASRHLYRMPYSLHEKSGLASVPVNINNILKFTKKQAEPEKIAFGVPFLDREKASREECRGLILNAYDFYPDKKEEKKEVKEYLMPEEAIPEEYFPPTIKTILEGLEDGKKRATFTLINFLKGAGWPIEAIEEKIYLWNEKNPEPLREVYLKGQLNQARKQKEAIPPHNYPSAGDNYYQDLRVWNPDPLEKKMKNPLQYAKYKFEQDQKKKSGRPKLTEEQKEMRRKYREKKKNES